MKWFRICWLLVLLCCFPSSAAPPTQNMVIAVIADDKESTVKLAEIVRRVRDSNNFIKELIPIARIPATQLKPADFERVGFSKQSLPVVALMKISTSDNLESVWGTPPAIVRNVTQGDVAAQIILCRWAEFASVKLPPALESVAQIYQPFRVFILNTARDPEGLARTAAEIARVKAAERISDKDLPVLSVMFGEGIVTAEDYTRLGFGIDALPAVCLVKMSDCANPSTIAGDTGLLRWSYSSSYVAREVVRQWSRLKGLPLKTIPAAEPFSVSSPYWVDLPPKLVAGQSMKFRYLARNYRFGPEGRVWLQEDTRIVLPDGTPFPSLGGQTNHRWDKFPGDGEITLESTVVLPSRPGRYTLEISTRDKLGNAKGLLSIPFDI